MGRFNAALYYRLIAFLLFVSTSAYAESKTGTIKGVKFPQYSDEGALEYMLYSKVANPSGVVIDMNGVLVDFIQPNIKINEIKDNRTVKLYSIEQASVLDPQIPVFWEKYSASKVFCRTPKAKYDRVTKLLRGDDKVRFRSKSMDIDGIGFDMDQRNGKLHIRTNVHVVLRDEKDEQKKSDTSEKIKGTDNEK